MKESKGQTDSEIQREHFNRISETYITSRSNPKHLAYKALMWEYIFKKLEQHMRLDESALGLDAMCGNAEVADQFCDRFPGLRMHAFDYSDEMVASAKAAVRNPVHVYQQDVLAIEHENKYDFAVLIGGLHHVPHKVDVAMRNLHKALKPGGLFINLEPTHNNFLWRWVRERIYKKNDLFEESTEEGFRLKDYNRLLADSNFDVAYQFYPGLLGYILYYNPDAFPALNKGSVGIAKKLCKMDLSLGNTWFGKYFSFNTWTFARKR